MSSSRPKKSAKTRPAAPEGGSLRAHKEEKFQLHDEADLVNFRADALTRFITNQDLMDNVTSKLIHTSRLAPPRSFPGNEGKNKLYEDNATDEAIMEAAKNVTPTQLFSGDLPLMRAKAKLSARELAESHEELEKVMDTSILSEKSSFQKRAVKRLADAQSQCSDAESLEHLESVLERTLQEYKDKFKNEYTFDDRSVKKYSLPLSELDPDADLKLAPADYNPRSIMSFVNIKEKEEDPNMAVPRIPGPHSEMLDLSNGMPIEQRYTSSEYIAGGPDYDDFEMMTSDKLATEQSDEMQFDPQLATQQIQSGEAGASSELAQNHNMPGTAHTEATPAQELAPMNNDVDMDDIDQFLADPDANDGMDALIDFDQPNDNGEGSAFENREGHAQIDDDPFGVDFLQSMGTDMA
ncbi:hypothetical protein OXX79_002431 [Metschnikowia pulcherrima]